MMAMRRLMSEDYTSAYDKQTPLRTHRHFPATIVRRHARFAAWRRRIAGAQWQQDRKRRVRRAPSGKESMHNVVQPVAAIKANAPGAKIWRDLARLAAESLAIGIAFSVLL